MKWTVKILLLLLLIPGQITRTQTIRPSTRLAISVDCSRFSYSPDTGYVEVSYLLYPSNITLIKDQDTLKGSLRLHTKIKNSNTDALVQESLMSIPVVLTDTSMLVAGIVWKSVFMLPINNYEISVFGYDNNMISNKDSVQKKISIERRTAGTNVSDIELCSRIVHSQNKENPFYKNTYEVTPHPSLLFGKGGAPVIFSYMEMYNLEHDFAYHVTMGIMDRSGKFIKEKKHLRRFANPNVIDVQSMNIIAIPSGSYRYCIILADTLGKEIAHVEKPIFIYNPQVTSATNDVVSARGIDFAGMSEDELKDEFQKAGYIASSEAKGLFEKSTASLRGLREFMAAFWTGVEKNPLGITRRLYLDRILIADKRYSILGRKGWHSDRGRVFVLNGEPNEIERFPSSENAKPYELWRYDQVENGVVFVFVDQSGYGDYRLIHSTKRGELYDEQWEKKLQ